MKTAHTIRLIWRTESGTGSTELQFYCRNYTEALELGREHFKRYFTGYTLVGTSIA